jgi:lysophospholipase L1-like esterase
MAEALVMLGDSLTDWGDWGELLGRGDVVNLGIAGDTTGDVLARLDEVEAVRPKKIFVMVGVNDLLRGESVGAVEARYEQILEGIRRLCPEAAVTVQSVLPVHERKMEGALKNATVDDLNRRLRALAGKHTVAYVDVGAKLADGRGDLDARYTVDGLHLNDAGYRAWAEALSG